MGNKIGRQALCLALLCAMSLCINASAQTYVRYVVPADIGTKSLYSDEVLPSVTLPRGVFRVDNNPAVRDAAFELIDILRDKDTRLLSVYVCGSASPDGLWQENVNLSDARTSATAQYLHHVTGISMERIHQESLNEDWERLYELVEASDIEYRREVLDIIRTMDWGPRKTALQKLGGGKVWKVLMKDFFPQLRCVRIAFYCLWDSSKPYMKSPDKMIVVPEEPECEVVEEPVKPKTVISRTDTVYVRDTIYYMKETVYIPQHVVPAESAERRADMHDTPWMMGFKTNLVGDAIVVPALGAEIQLGKKVSLDLQGFMTRFNAFNNFDENTNVYGFSPELRFWPGGRTMRKGQFIGIHARCAWYTLQWKDGLLYQNGPEGKVEGEYLNAGNLRPAWSAGLTYGYSLGFGKKGHWGLEFLVGLGYASYRQNIATLNDGIWEFTEHRNEHHFGITRVGVNLTYRFSLRRVDPKYYDNN